MADDSNKVTIVLDLDNQQFVQKSGESQSAFEQFSKTISGSFDQAIFGAISLNQALELGSKIMEGFDAVLRTINFAESFKNQEIALSSLTKNIGVDASALTDSIKKATGGTVTSLEATQTAFKLLNAGIRSESVPAVAEYAEWVEKSTGGQKKFADVIAAVSTALETGSSRGLKEYGIKVGAVGDRTEILNSILDQARQKMQQTGGQFEETGKIIETRFKEAQEVVKSFWGEVAGNVGFAIFGTEAEKNTKRLADLKAEMFLVEQAHKSGETEFKNGLTYDETKAYYLKEIAELQGKVTESIKEETEVTAKQNDAIKQTVTIKQQLTLAQQQQVTIEGKAAAAQAQVAKEESEMGSANLKSYQELNSARRAEIDRTFQLERQRVLETPQTYAEAKAKIAALEIAHEQKIKAIRVDDTTFMEAQSAAETNYILKNLNTVADAKTKLIAKEESDETKSYQKQMEKLRMAGLTKNQFDKQMEIAETNHQAAIQAIRDKYDKVSMKNMTLGLNQSLTAMKKQYGSFSTFVANTTTKTHGIMTNAFADMAKGHGDAMQVMLGQFLEMIGMQMIEAGIFHLLMGIWPPNPIELGQGAALLGGGMALVGAGASMGGGSGASSASTDSGAISSPATATPGVVPGSPGVASGAQQDSKKATIVIQGDFLNSRETGNHLADILRQNSDITDYSITAQGKQYA